MIDPKIGFGYRSKLWLIPNFLLARGLNESWVSQKPRHKSQPLANFFWLGKSIKFQVGKSFSKNHGYPRNPVTIWTIFGLSIMGWSKSRKLSCDCPALKQAFCHGVSGIPVTFTSRNSTSESDGFWGHSLGWKNLRFLDGDLGSVMKSGEPPEFDRLPFKLEACQFCGSVVTYITVFHCHMCFVLSHLKTSSSWL